MFQSRYYAFALLLLASPLLGGEEAQENIVAKPQEWSVVDQEGRPIAGVEVWMLPRRRPEDAPWAWSRVAVTQKDGRFSVMDRKEAAFRVCHPRYRPEPVPKNSCGDRPFQIQLSPSTSLSGRVVDPYGKPILGARVAATIHSEIIACSEGPAPPAPPPVCNDDWESTTDASGSFRIGALTEGWKEIRLSAEDHVAVELRKEIRLRQEGTLEVVLNPAAVLNGRVTDVDGVPIAGAHIVASGGCVFPPYPTTETTEDGLYQLRCLQLVLQRVQVKHDGYETALQEVQIHSGDNLLDVTLQPRKRKRAEPVYKIVRRAAPEELEDRSSDPRNAPPNGRAPVLLQGRILGLEPGDVLWLVEAKGADPEPRYTWPSSDLYVLSLTPGPWDVMAHWKGHFVKQRIVIPPATDKVNLDLDFAFGQRTLSGRLYYEGMPIGDLTGMDFEIASLDPAGMSAEQYWHLGTFRFEKLREGRYLLRVKEDEDILYEQEVDLSTDRDLVIDLAETER